MRKPRCALIAAVAGGLSLPVLPTVALAYARTQSETTGTPVYWSDPRIAMVLTRPPANFGIRADAIVDVVRDVLRPWSTPEIPCTSLNLALWPTLEDDDTLGRDGRNRVIFRTDDWCAHRKFEDGEFCPETAVALTSLLYWRRPGRPNDAEILEADIEVNGVSFFWAVIPEDGTIGPDIVGKLDLPSALAHEVGHLIGLAHNCTLGDEMPAGDVDDAGNPVLPCSMAPPQLAEATMYPSLEPGQFSLRSLSPDETRAACELYPSESVPIESWSGGGVGCSMRPASKTPVSAAVWIVLLPLLLVSMPRRRGD